MFRGFSVLVAGVLFLVEAGVAEGGISASVSDLAPCDEEVEVAVTWSAKYSVSVSAGETNSWRFKIRLESVYDATSAIDGSSELEVDVAPGNSITNANIATTWNLSNRLGEHSLSVTIFARELSEGGPPTLYETAASQLCTYTVVAGGEERADATPRVDSSNFVPDAVKNSGGQASVPRVNSSIVVPDPVKNSDQTSVPQLRSSINVPEAVRKGGNLSAAPSVHGVNSVPERSGHR